MRPQSSSAKKPAEQVVKTFAVRHGVTSRRKIRSGSCWKAARRRQHPPSNGARYREGHQKKRKLNAIELRCDHIRFVLG
jgi:hypothetical protein